MAALASTLVIFNCIISRYKSITYIAIGLVASSAPAAQPYVYATNTLGNAVAVINPTSYALVANIVTGTSTSPAQVALSLDGSRVYASNQGNNTVSIISTASNTVLSSPKVGSGPVGLAVTPNGSFVYVANQISNTVSVINTSTQSVIATIPVVSSPFAVAVSPDGTRVWVAGTTSNRISVINTSNNSVASTLAATNSPVSLAFSPSGTRVYVANEFANMVAVYDAVAGTVLSTISTPGAPTCVTLSGDGSHAYVTSADNKDLYVIDTSRNSIISTIATGTFPDGVAVSSDGTLAWVSNAQDYSISVIDTIHGNTLKTLYGMAYYPQGIAMTPTAPASVSVSVSPSSVSLLSAVTQQFSATVTGSTNTAVTWSISPSVGSISSAGLYSAPLVINLNQSVTVTATSAADPSKSAHATVTLLPKVSVSLSPTSVTLVHSQTQQFTSSVTGSTNTAVTWSISPTIGTISSGGLYTAPSSITNTETVTVKATSVADTSKSASAVITLVPSLSFSPIRVNCGGPAYTDPSGNPWSADYGYTGGLTSSTTSSISGTTNPVLYQSGRYFTQTGQYQFSVPNGSYTVNLKFAEIYAPATVGARVGNYVINGRTALSKFDVLAVTGAHNAAIDEEFPVNVTGGQIVIQIVPVVGYPKISAIQILLENGAPLRVNSGGPAYTDPSGNLWSADYGYSGGLTSGTSNSISNTTTPVLYQTQRYFTQTGTYQFSVPNGAHFVTLKFAEIYPPAKAGARVGSYVINGQTVLSNFDVMAAAGGQDIAIDKQYPVTVTNGQMVIQIVPVVGYPKISAIEID